MFYPPTRPVPASASASAPAPVPPVDDESLIDRSRDGDQAAIHTLVARHAPVAFRIAYRMVGRRDRAEDIAHDVLIRMLSYQEGWRSRAGFHAWLRRAVINRAIDVHRRERFWVVGDSIALAEVPHDDLAADDALDLRHREQKVAAAMLRLPERQRAAITLCFYEHLSLQDAADALNATVGAVESLLQRAKTALKQDLLSLKGDAR